MCLCGAQLGFASDAAVSLWGFLGLRHGASNLTQWAMGHANHCLVEPCW